MHFLIISWVFVNMEFWTWNQTSVCKSSIHLVAPASEERETVGQRIKNLKIEVGALRKVGVKERLWLFTAKKVTNQAKQESNKQSKN